MECNASVDEILSGSEKGFGLFENFLIGPLYRHWLEMIDDQLSMINYQFKPLTSNL
jgi:hypothetical protein